MIKRCRYERIGYVTTQFTSRHNLKGKEIYQLTEESDTAFMFQTSSPTAIQLKNPPSARSLSPRPIILRQTPSKPAASQTTLGL